MEFKLYAIIVFIIFIIMIFKEIQNRIYIYKLEILLQNIIKKIPQEQMEEILNEIHS